MDMISVLSATEHDFYAMPLPFAVFSWRMIGVSCIVFVPRGDNPKLQLAKKYCGQQAVFFEFDAEEKRIPTFSQVSRLFGAALPFYNDETVMVTADSDICVFGDYFKQFEDGNIHVIGADLTPEQQYPMCFILMSVKNWRTVFGIYKSYQEHIAELINPIQGMNIRGEQWSYDQWFAKKKIDASGLEVFKHNRSNGQNQFATRRIDRDNIAWRESLNLDLIDAHLWRPLYIETNFDNLLEMFKYFYPNENLHWMTEYKNEYLQLCQK